MILCHKCGCGPSFSFIRNISVISVLECNHYKILGLSPSATHSEIKSAYYELSKKHHPDKNHGSEQSAKTFRDIAQAYEVLGNEKTRKQYDREHFFDSRSETSYTYNKTQVPDIRDDLETFMYHWYRNNARYGKTKHYNFDAWYKEHYGNNRYGYDVKLRKMYRNTASEQAKHQTAIGYFINKTFYLAIFGFLAIVYITELFSYKRGTPVEKKKKD